MRAAIASTLTLGLLAAPPAWAAFEGPRPEDAPPPALALEPSPHMTPRQVVEIQLRALAANAEWGEDRGIALTFRFASPGNQRQTGPLPRFARMVKGATYGALVDHRRAELGPTRLVDGQAVVPVVIQTADGDRRGFLWVLGRQVGGAHRDCWMTDAVLPARPDRAAQARTVEL